MCCIIFHRGDDLGQLTETAWPDAYVPEAGIGDLTGMCNCFLFCH